MKHFAFGLITTCFSLMLICSPLMAEGNVQAIEYELGGVTFESQLIVGALSDETASSPAVLIIPQWMGISEHELTWGARLAELGFTVLVADMYGQDVNPTNRDEAAAQTKAFYADESRELFRSRANAAFLLLQAQQGVDPERIFVIGFCFGGTGALELARSGAALAGAVSFHGRLNTTQPAQPGQVNCPVLVCHGGADPGVPWEQVTELKEELDGAGVEFRLVVYSDAVHAFTQPGAGNDPSRGHAYNETAARDSWQQMIRFFEDAVR